MMKRFTGHVPRVERLSKASIAEGKGVVDPVTGKKGVHFSIDEMVSEPGDSVRVKARYYEGTMSAAGYTYTLKKVEGRWIIIKREMDWIS
jgi:hypothetical protein